MVNFWTDEKIFLDGDLYFESLINDIDQAKTLITVEIYMFSNDGLGNEIATHLISAHQRGVKVEIVVDGVGSYSFFEVLHKRFSEAKIAVKMFHPLPFYHPQHESLSLKQKITTLFTRLWRMNQRNHRKIVTIDRFIMYAGSLNFSAEHTKYHNAKKWKDMGVRVEGPNVKIAVLHFKKIWKLKEYFSLRKEMKPLLTRKLKYSPLRLNYSLFMKRFYYRDLIRKINHAQSRIWLMTPYFIPKRRLIRVLGKAATRGVDVRILISSKSDIHIFQKLQSFYYAYLAKKGVRMFEYVETILHAKTFIIDDWVTIGSSNLNHRSILHDLEVDLAIQDQGNKLIITNDFIASTPSQLEITMEDLKHRTVFDKFLSRLFFVFKYWF
jgi:cardiolipin synthase